MVFKRWAGLALMIWPAIAQSEKIPAEPRRIAASAETAVSSGSWRSAANTAFALGEKLEFSISWGIIKGGTATMSVEGLSTTGNRPAYHLVTKANSAGVVDSFYRVRDRNDAWLDKDSLTSARFDRHINEGKYRIEDTVEFDQLSHQFSYHSHRTDKDVYEVKSGTVTPNIMDVLSSLYYVRTLPLKVGDSYTMDVLSSEKVWPLVMTVKKRQTVKVPAGKFDAFLVEPVLREPGIFVAKGKKLEVWLTADERHLPVKMRCEVFIGHVAADLVDYRLHEPPPAPPAAKPVNSTPSAL